VADRGFAGVLLKSTDQTRTYDPATGELQAGAGLEWDELVAFSVTEGAGGIECLAGIPGLCGAAPVQNIGAYGQEVGEVLTGLSATDLATGQSRDFSVDECALGYRHSRFKGEEAGRWVITSIRLRLHPGAPPALRYEELRERLASESGAGLDRVRDAVLDLRRGKSMVYDPADPNHRSAGSFFTNPVVDRPVLERIGDTSMPRWPVDGDRVKIPAAWLIERSGFAKGHRRGAAGLSTRHVLALINRGGATAADLLALAREVRDAVLDRFGIRLRPEPVPLGFEPGEIDDLWGSQDVE
jgi:UDP-N-acetylmuramate dehydrogenase